ncbi:hypothetical protein HBH61_037720 [Parastagonospora nodorum]|nr:hypothetical protein HBI09_027380 [Parastagonospora nodorum]KAH4608846.1 hypothetical protein HBH82_067110 [Parastagonospora nodorum]KAH4711629.1 hypothetical protein HBH67_023600 [Parastagonospora nodorum]KAH4718232.1 hypothetical protein HBH78_027610 [Parastagonospora nodorum]KAH4785953.1 hypothetical protein HBH62_084600 [Parastagonospora nodorum]
MSKEQNGDTNGARPEADFAEAMKELQRGERTAAALEGHLDSLEKKIEELLVQAEKADQELKTDPKDASDKPTDDTSKSTS